VNDIEQAGADAHHYTAFVAVNLQEVSVATSGARIEEMNSRQMIKRMRRKPYIPHPRSLQ